jgi:lipoate-protein ligase A
MERATWRLIFDDPHDGAFNMAVDAVLLEEAASRRSPPALRLYSWDPPALSLGYAQHVADCDREALRGLGWGLVRRPTGGRAILHIDELTYSVAAPADDPHVRGSVLESCRNLSRGLMAGLNLLGVEAAADARPSARGARSPVCFEISSDYEITAGGKKIIGSAQARAHWGILQHGALPLRGDLARILPVLTRPETSPERIRRRAATLGELLGREVSWQEAADALVRGFSETLGISFRPGELRREEKTRAGELARVKFGSEAWTGRV